MERSKQELQQPRPSRWQLSCKSKKMIWDPIKQKIEKQKIYWENRRSETAESKIFDFAKKSCRKEADASKEAPEGERILLLGLEQLRQSPEGPRKDFQDGSLLALAASIRQHGLLEPLLVRPTKDPSAPFALIDGHRRLRALEILGQNRIPCRVWEATAEEGRKLALIGNLHRLPLNYFEQAQAEAALLDQSAVEALSTVLCEPTAALIARQSLLRLDRREQQLLLAAGVPEDSAVALSEISDPPTRLAALEDLCRQVGERSGGALLQASATAVKLSKSRKRLLVKDLRLFYNSIDRAVAAVKESGLRARCDIREEPDRQVIEITLLKEQ